MSKNIQRVQEMINGTYRRKIQVGYKRIEKKREVGERWFDSDGKEWEQKNGYIASIRKLPSKGLGDNCPDCNKLIIKKWDKDVFFWNGKCYYCQIDFEAELRGTGKYDEWLEGKGEKFKKDWIERFEKENEEFVKELEKLDNPFDMKVANAMSNENVSMNIKNAKG